MSSAFVLLFSRGTSLACVADIIQERSVSLGQLAHLPHVVGDLLAVVGVNRLQVLAVTLFPTSHQHRKLLDHLFVLVDLQGSLDAVEELQYLLKQSKGRLRIADLGLRSLLVLLDHHVSQSLVSGRLLVPSVLAVRFVEVVFQFFDALLENVILRVRRAQEGAADPRSSRAAGWFLLLSRYGPGVVVKQSWYALKRAVIHDLDLVVKSVIVVLASAAGPIQGLRGSIRAQTVPHGEQLLLGSQPQVLGLVSEVVALQQHLVLRTLFGQ